MTALAAFFCFFFLFFMVPSAMLKVEICEIIGREYISPQTWRSHPTCYECYGGSDSHSLDMYVCVCVCA